MRHLCRFFGSCRFYASSYGLHYLQAIWYPVMVLSGHGSAGFMKDEDLSWAQLHCPCTKSPGMWCGLWPIHVTVSFLEISYKTKYYHHMFAVNCTNSKWILPLIEEFLGLDIPFIFGL